MERLDFGALSIFPWEKRVTLDGCAVSVGPRAFNLLSVLAQHRGRVLGKHELLQLAWPGLVVEENNLTVQIAALRKALGGHVVVTVPGQGYRFNLASEAAPVRAKLKGNLPHFSHELFGRTDELTILAVEATSSRLVTLCGPGGIGKSTLAMALAKQVAGQFAQGAWLVDLSAVEEPRLVYTAVAQVLGVILTGSTTPQAELAAALETRELLLVLDGCEHLLATVAALTNEVLRTASAVRVLATSQEPLRVHGERLHNVRPLEVPPPGEFEDAQRFAAIQLFVERVKARQADFQLATHEVANAVEICQELDGIALAIELAAARVPLMGVAMVRSRLGERLRLLTGGPRTAARRHQTLRSTLEWSHQLLSHEEQLTLRRLSVFVGGFSMEDAEHLLPRVADQDLDVSDLLGALAEKSMLVIERRPRLRYRMLESMRTFAASELASAGESADWSLRHARAMVQSCLAAAKSRDVVWMWQEMANARAALSYAVQDGRASDEAVALATLTAPVLTMAGFVPEAMDKLLQVQRLVNATTPKPIAAKYWQWLGRFGMEGRLPISRCCEALETAQNLFAELTQPRHVHACLRMRAEAMLRGGGLDSAQTLLHAAEALEAQEFRPADRMRRLRVAALLADAQGDFDLALRLTRHALDIAETQQVRQYALLLNAEIAWVQLRMGDTASAVSLLQSLLDQIKAGHRHGLLWAYTLAGHLAALVAAGRFEEAKSRLPGTLQTLRQSGLFLSRSDTLAWLAAASAQPRTAARLMGAADSFNDRTETRRDRISQYARQRAQELVATELTPEDISYAMEEGRRSDEATLAAILQQALANVA